jgi:hypothetical protein
MRSPITPRATGQMTHLMAELRMTCWPTWLATTPSFSIRISGAPVVTHLLAAADELLDFLDGLAVNVPPLQAALTELEGRFEMIANALQEFLHKDASPPALHQDNFAL